MEQHRARDLLALAREAEAHRGLAGDETVTACDAVGALEAVP